MGGRGEVREASGGLEALGGWAGLRGPGGAHRSLKELSDKIDGRGWHKAGHIGKS